MFSANLKEYREKAGLTQTQLAEKITNITGKKTTYENIKSWENGTNPKINDIYACAEVLNIPEQVLFDNSEKSLKKVIQIMQTNEKDIVPTKEINLFDFITKVHIKNGYVGAGSSGLLQEDEIIKELYIDTHQIVKKFREYKINGIQVVGDSMKPYVDNGDIVLYVDIPDNYPKITGKYIINLNGNLQVKNISFRLNGDIIISSENKSYPDEVIEKDSQELDNFEIVGIIAGRMLKE